MTMRSPVPGTPRRLLARAIDLACLVTFVFAGAGQHDVDHSVGWFFTVLWPLVFAWFGIALVTRLYRSADRVWLRLTITLGAGALLNAALRWAFTDRPLVSVYTLVFMAWMVLTAYGWRAFVLLRDRRRAVA